MQNRGVPQETQFLLIGNSIYLRIPPSNYKHHNLQEMKKENGPNKKTAKIMREKNSEGEHYSSYWNPEHPTQSEKQ